MIAGQRKSNIELLRLVLMFFILMHHYFVRVKNAWPIIDGESDIFASFVDPFLYVGVNCFVLISGYFGIRFRFRGLYGLFMQCAFYGLLFYLIHLYVDHATIGRSIIYNSLLVFSMPPGWWFIRVYVFLYLLSPILNKAIDRMSQSQLKLSLLILTVLNVYFGYLQQTPFNQDGYNIANFIFLYFIGRYIKLYYDEKKNHVIKYLLGYFAVSAVMGIIALYNVNSVGRGFHTILLNVYVYNNPLLIIASVFLFLVFVSIRIPSSSFINWLSVSALSIYLITENSYFGQLYYPFISNCIKNMSEVLSYISLVVFALITMGCCILIDKIRRFIMIPIDRFALGVADRLDKKCMDNWYGNNGRD